VPPQTTDPATTGASTSNFPIGKHRKHKGTAVANTDSKGATTTTPQTGPVVTGVEPSSSCDADGDGVPDAGAPSCSTGSPAPTTQGDGLVTGSLEPAQPSTGSAKKPRANSGKRSTPKKKSASKKK
jgi:hypothetical protein